MFDDSVGTFEFGNKSHFTLNNAKRNAIELSKPTEIRVWEEACREARRLGVPRTILPIDIDIPEVCPERGTAWTKTGSHSPTVQRLNANLGFVPGNVRVVSKAALS